MARAMDDLEPAKELFLGDIASNRWELLRHAKGLDLVQREPEALPMAEQLLAVAIEVDDNYLAAAASALLVSILSVDADVPTSRLRDLGDSALGYAAESEWWDGVSIAFALIMHALAKGEYERAGSIFEEAAASGSEGWYGNWLPLLGATIYRNLGDVDAAFAALDSIEPEDDDEMQRWVTERAHALISLGRLDEAIEQIREMMSFEDVDERDAFCPAADYFRAKGDHRTAVWLMANMLEGRPPSDEVHRAVIREGREALGANFDAEWDRGERMSPAALRSILGED